MPRPERNPTPLFSQAARRAAAARAPLAERLRPRTLDELLGQQALLAPGSLLRRQVAEGRLSSLLLQGPPGCGKTTLARVLAREAAYELEELSAVSAGVADVRAVLRRAEERLGTSGRPTLLFVDEIHRFHKGQQDALLHEVEDGRVVLLGATTENPAWSVVPALLSRCRLIRLQPLDRAACEGLVERALGDPERGLAPPVPRLSPPIRELLVGGCGGDARRLLDQLEQAVRLARAEGAQSVTEAHLEGARGARTLAHDKAGDRHYDLLSALHKSLRGSDPDAAAYWVQRLLAAGESPDVVARRLVRMASEDVGLADPRALAVALDAQRAAHFLGLPEGDAALVQAAIYLALAPKSDAVYRAAGAAREAVETHGALPVPLALRNAPTAMARRDGHGRGYVHPHAVPGGVAPTQDYRPEALQDAVFYEPGGRGAEGELARRLAELRRLRREARESRGRGEAGGAAGPAGASGRPG